MQGNFNINLPSIPTALIRFKIQDVKSKGFNAKQARFKDNKTYLQSRFINSFSNLSPLSPPKTNPQNQNKSQLSTNVSSFFRQQNDDFRIFVEDNKKNLLIKYQNQYKDYQPPIQGENKFDKGFKFSKSGMNDSLEKEVSKFSKHSNSKIIDNYYFNGTQESEDQSQGQNEQKIQLEKRRQQKLAKKKIVRPSAAFKGQERFQSFERDLKNKIKPGPGSYLFQNEPNKKSTSVSKKQEKKGINMQRIKHILQKNYFNPEQKSNYQTVQSEQNPLNKRSSSMFIQGNQDRFGNPIYPISSKLSVPGPGAYSFHDNLQDKANKILILEQQRKLLKQWYNQA